MRNTAQRNGSKWKAAEITVDEYKMMCKKNIGG